MLFSKKIPPRCAYCAFSREIKNAPEYTCKFKGLVTGDYCCRKYRYDAVKRVPAGKLICTDSFAPDDFKL